MPKGFYKHRLLLDENMPHRSEFPILNSKFDVKHIEDDLGKGGLAGSGCVSWRLIKTVSW